MAIKLNGIWQLGVGIYLEPFTAPYQAKIILNGKEFIADQQHFLCFDGYSDDNAARSVMSYNIQTLPRKKKSPVSVASVINDQ